MDVVVYGGGLKLHPGKLTAVGTPKSWSFGSDDVPDFNSHRIHVWYIYLHLDGIFTYMKG